MRLLRLACTVLLCAFAMPVLAAAQYPMTVTDLAGRSVTLARPPQRVVLQDGRNIVMLAMLDRDDPFNRVKLWNNILSRDDAATWALLAGKWPDSRAIPDMGFGDNGQVDAERILASRPDLVVAERRALASLTEAGVVAKLDGLGIPLLVVDTFNDPVPGATKSVALLGRVLDREAEAAEYTTFYDAHLKAITDAAAATKPQPRIFVEALAGRSGPEQCCFTHNKVGWGALVAAIGARNIGSELLSGATGDVTMETVLAQKPDVYVMTGSQSSRPNNAYAPFGYGADPAPVQSALALLERRPGFAQLQAARDGRVFGLWHLFYNSPLNIVGLEYLARFAFPDKLAALDPADTYRTIMARFTHIPASPFLFAAKAPPAGG